MNNLDQRRLDFISFSLVFVTKNKDGEWILENTECKGMLYKAKPEDLEEVKDESTN